MTDEPIAFFRDEYRWLSNFAEADIEGIDGYGYSSVEHAYQSAKFYGTTRDKAFRDIIMDGTAREAKIFARKNKKYVRKNFNDTDRKLSLMLKLVSRKFEKHGYLRALLKTGNRPLIEGNEWHDNFWGDCYADTDIKGENNLGKILVFIREQERKSLHKKFISRVGEFCDELYDFVIPEDPKGYHDPDDYYNKDTEYRKYYRYETEILHDKLQDVRDIVELIMVNKP